MGRFCLWSPVLNRCLLLLIVAGCHTTPLPEAEWEAADRMLGELAPELLLDRYTPSDTPASLRVVTYNVEQGKATAEIAAAFADNEVLATADLLLVQEIEQHASETVSRSAALAAEFEMNYVYAPARTTTQGTHGLAILSRFPLGDVQVMQLPQFDFAIHTRQRVALAVDVLVGADTVRVVDVHLDTRLNITERIVQLHPAVIDFSERLIVAGDFNTNPYIWVAESVPLTGVHAASGLDQAAELDDYMTALGYSTPTAGSGPTQDAIVEQLRLDHIYVSGLDTGALGVERDISMSDHFPLWLDVAIP